MEELLDVFNMNVELVAQHLQGPLEHLHMGDEWEEFIGVYLANIGPVMERAIEKGGFPVPGRQL